MLGGFGTLKGFFPRPCDRIAVLPAWADPKSVTYQRKSEGKKETEKEFRKIWRSIWFISGWLADSFGSWAFIWSENRVRFHNIIIQLHPRIPFISNLVGQLVTWYFIKRKIVKDKIAQMSGLNDRIQQFVGLGLLEHWWSASIAYRYRYRNARCNLLLQVLSILAVKWTAYSHIQLPEAAAWRTFCSHARDIIYSPDNIELWLKNRAWIPRALRWWLLIQRAYSLMP